MAYFWETGGNEYLDLNGNPWDNRIVGATAVTAAMWIETDFTSITQRLIHFFDSSAFTLFSMFLNSDASNVLTLRVGGRAGNIGESFRQTGSNSTLSADTVYHVAVIHDVTNDYQAVYINGSLDAGRTVPAFGANNFQTRTPGTQRLFASEVNAERYDGRAHTAAMWNVRLEPEEIAALALGVDPLHVRAEDHVFYVPLLNDLKERSGLGDPTVNGTPVLTEDEMVQRRFRSPPILVPPPSAAPTGVTLTVAESSHGHTADEPTLSQANNLTVAEATHAHTADELTLSQATVLAVQEATHPHAAEAPTLTQAHVLAVQEALHAHVSDGVTLTEAATLAVAEAVHGHTADEVTVSLSTVLLVDEAGHAHAVESPTLAVAYALAVDEALHAHAADAPSLSQGFVLVVQEAAHGHTVDAVSLVNPDLALVLTGVIHAESATVRVRLKSARRA